MDTLLSRVPNPSGLSNTQFLFPPRRAHRRSRWKPSSDSMKSHSRVRAGAPEFNQVARTQGDPKEVKVIEKDARSGLDYVRAGADEDLGGRRPFSNLSGDELG